MSKNLIELDLWYNLRSMVLSPMGYHLADGIYLKWSIFVKTIPSPQGQKRKLFVKAQEANRKDVEHAFGVLQARFTIVHGPARFFYSEVL